VEWDASYNMPEPCAKLTVAYAGADHHRVPHRISRDVYFLRNRSRRTTSAPSLGLSSGSGLSATSTGAVAVSDAGAAAVAGRFDAGASAAPSDDSNWRPNCTEGSKKLLMAANGTTRRSGMPPKDRPTSKRSSLTSRSQN